VVLAVVLMVITAVLMLLLLEQQVKVMPVVTLNLALAMALVVAVVLGQLVFLVPVVQTEPVVLAFHHQLLVQQLPVLAAAVVLVLLKV
jgi:hypothetical protein